MKVRSVFFFLLCTGLLSCEKEFSDVFITDPFYEINDTAWAVSIPENAPVNDLPGILGEAANTATFTYSGAATTVVAINDSQRLYIAPEVLLVSNSPVTVNARITQLKTRGEFVGSGRVSNSYIELMDAASMFNIAFNVNGNTVAIKPGKAVVFVYKSRSASPVSRKVFYDTLFGPVYHTWDASNDGISRVLYTGSKDSVTFRKTANWIAPGTILDTTGMTWSKVQVVLPPNFTNKNTAVYAVYKNYSVVVSLQADRTSRLFNGIKLYTGQPVKLVALSKIDNQLYYAEKEITLPDAVTLKLTPEQKSKPDIQLALKNLY
jgi:hypothetical protein